MLKDSAKLQEEEASFARKKGYSKHADPKPLYFSEDVDATLALLNGCDFHTWININEYIAVKFSHSGHILGAAIVEIMVKGNHQSKKLVFSGDLGRAGSPLHFPPESIKEADIVWVESTYGSRSNTSSDPESELEAGINAAEERRGVVLIPAFSVGRTQLLLFYLYELFRTRKIDSGWSVYIDSPMSISVTNLYERYASLHKLDSTGTPHGHQVFDFPNFHYTRAQTESNQLIEIKEKAIILSASGMCTGGRVLHHLFHRLRRQEDTVLFVGYQAKGTRGDTIQSGAEEVKIFGEHVPIRCHVASIEGLSAHADHGELISWISQIKERPKLTFVVHGEEQSSESMVKELEQKGWNALAPHYLETVQLFEGI